MKLLYATSNDSKIYNMKRRLKGLPIELITPKDIDLKLDIQEDGQSVVENALKKAKTYYEATKMPTIAGDSKVYINNIPNEKQPGLFVRRINGKKLTDEEMLEYYTNLIDSIGGQTTAYCTTGLALITKDFIKTIEIKEDEFIMTSKISSGEHRGDPFNVMSISPITNKYYSDMTDEEFEKLGLTFDQKCKEFITNNLKIKRENK